MFYSDQNEYFCNMLINLKCQNQCEKPSARYLEKVM